MVLDVARSRAQARTVVIGQAVVPALTGALRRSFCWRIADLRPDSACRLRKTSIMACRSPSNCREYSSRIRQISESFEYIARYFENSLTELQERNDQVETDFRRIDANRFQARAFVGGQERAMCGIWLGGSFDTDALYFSFNGVGDGTGYNESMSVSDDGYALFLQPLGMAHAFARQTDPALTMEGAGEYF